MGTPVRKPSLNVRVPILWVCSLDCIKKVSWAHAFTHTPAHSCFLTMDASCLAVSSPYCYDSSEKMKYNLNCELKQAPPPKLLLPGYFMTATETKQRHVTSGMFRTSQIIKVFLRLRGTLQHPGSYYLPWFPSSVSTVVINTITKSKTWKWFVWFLYPDHSPSLRKPRQELKENRKLETGTEAEAPEECCLLACSMAPAACLFFF